MKKVFFGQFLSILDENMLIKVIPHCYYDEGLGCTRDNEGDVAWHIGTVRNLPYAWKHGDLDNYEITNMHNEGNMLVMWIRVV